MKRTFAYRLFNGTHELTHLATQKRKGFIFPLEILIFFAVFIISYLASVIPGFLAGLILLVVQGEEGMQRLVNMDGATSTAVGLFFTAVPMLIVILFCVFLQKRSVQSMGFRGRDFLIQYGKGLLVGFAMFSLVLAIGALFGGFRFAGMEQPIQPAFLLLFFLGFMLQGMEEEVVCRGYFMISLSRRSPMWLAVLLNAAVFALGHIMNPGAGIFPMINLIIFGIFASLYMLRTGNIWGVGAIHSIWNYVQGNFYGLPVSGMTDMPSLMRFELSGSALISGGEFGPEGGLPVTLVYLIGILLTLFLPEKEKGESEQTVL